jgi:hypothetical protein
MSFDLLAPVIGKPKPKTPQQIAAEAAAAAAAEEEKNSIEMETFKATTNIRDPKYPDRQHVGGRRRKSRRGKSRKYKRTLKRRKNKTKNRK